MYMWVQVPKLARGIDLPGPGVKGSCKFLGINPGNQIRVLCKNQELLSHLSSTLNQLRAIKAYMQHTIANL